jgi:phage tail-like protein
MSCGPRPTTFRLLDPYVGWDVASAEGLTGFDDPAGVRLKLLADVTGVIDLGDLLSYFPPPRLAHGCGCRWYLARGERTPGLLVRDACLRARECWTDLSAGSCGPRFVHPSAVAARGHLVAVADRGAGTITVFSEGSWRIRSTVALDRWLPDGWPDVVSLACAPSGELVVGTSNPARVLCFDRTGARIGEWTAPGAVVRLAVDDDCAIWIVTRAAEGYSVWREQRGAALRDPHRPLAFVRASLADVVTAFTPTGLVAASLAGFCFVETDADGLPARRCYGWDGCPIDSSAVPPDAALQLVTHGQLLTLAIDSGIDRCRWHRVRLDADVPPGCTLDTAVASSGLPQPPPQGVAPAGEWSAFAAGVPHAGDWQTAPGGSLDFLVDQPPGRYLFVRLRFTGDGVSTPVVRRVRLCMPRSTSLDRLPDVYRETPDSEDFSERFLSLFDATIGDLDRAIVRYPALLDAGGVPDDVLPWLAGFLDIVCDARWTADQRRVILRAAPGLYKQRGTVAGLVRSIELATGLTAGIEELPLTRPWNTLGRKRAAPAASSSCTCHGGAPATTAASPPPPGAVVGGVRLFSRARARFRLGQSALGATPIKSYGDPDMDPVNALAYRFRVLAPFAGAPGSLTRLRLERLVASVKPAHTIATVRSTSDGFVVGPWARLGVDTAIHALPAPVLGSGGNVRLRRTTVLWPGPRRRGNGPAVGSTTVVGVNTVVQ